MLWGRKSEGAQWGWDAQGWRRHICEDFFTPSPGTWPEWLRDRPHWDR